VSAVVVVVVVRGVLPLNRRCCFRCAATTKARDFVQAFSQSEGASEAARVQLRAQLVDSAKTHNALTLDALAGQGVDRHMMGLRLMALTSGKPLPEVFRHPAFALEFKLSTSQPPLAQVRVCIDAESLSVSLLVSLDLTLTLTHSHSHLPCRTLCQEFIGALEHLYPLSKRSAGGGFSPVADAGFGVSYFIDGPRVHFFLSSRFDDGAQAQVDRLAALLSRAMTELAALASAPAAKQ
jgi:hypothetical protein